MWSDKVKKSKTQRKHIQYATFWALPHPPLCLLLVGTFEKKQIREKIYLKMKEKKIIAKDNYSKEIKLIFFFFIPLYGQIIKYIEPFKKRLTYFLGILIWIADLFRFFMPVTLKYMNSFLINEIKTYFFAYFFINFIFLLCNTFSALKFS